MFTHSRGQNESTRLITIKVQKVNFRYEQLQNQQFKLFALGVYRAAHEVKLTTLLTFLPILTLGGSVVSLCTTCLEFKTRQATYVERNMRRLLTTIVAVQKQQVLHILSVCVCSLSC